MRQPVKNMKDIRMVNDVTVVPEKLVIRRDLDVVLPIIKKQFKAMKDSLDAFGSLELFRVSAN
jgi:hypothetical protein